MKTKSISRLSVVALLAFLFFPVSCFYKRQAVAKRAAVIPNLPQDISIDFPMDMDNAQVDPELRREAAVIVSVPNEQQLYLGRIQVTKDQLNSRLSELPRTRLDPDKAVSEPGASSVVYLAAADAVNYDAVVQVLDVIRRQGFTRVGLIAGRRQKDDSSTASISNPGRLSVALPAAPDESEDLRLLPNPLTLVVSISSDLKLRLNNQEGPLPGQPGYVSGMSYGSVADPGTLIRCLTALFQARKEQRAYKPGFETRTELPEDERVEKSIFVKASRSIRYGAVVHVVDALKGAGANPIILQVDNLPQ